MNQRLIPTGFCWCGCGQDTERGAFFATGHDKRAESAVIRQRYGSVVEFLVAHGYGPGGNLLKAQIEKLARQPSVTVEARDSANPLGPLVRFPNCQVLGAYLDEGSVIVSLNPGGQVSIPLADVATSYRDMQAQGSYVLRVTGAITLEGGARYRAFGLSDAPTAPYEA